MDLLCGLMNTSQETERLQNALAGLATVMAKMVNERVEQALADYRLKGLGKLESDLRLTI